MKKLLMALALVPLLALAVETWSSMMFNANGGIGTSMSSLQMASGQVYKLPKCTFAPPEGKTLFAGWACSNGRRYDDEMLVFDLGNVTMTAIWDGEGEQYGGVQLWENGPYWAECNVGANQPEECGYYFWWGDTVGYKRNANDDGWISVKDSTSFSFSSGNCPTSGKDNAQLQSAGYIDATGNLVAARDAATAHRGAPWRMPTREEFLALADNCTTTWTTRNGVAGRLVTGKGAYASKSIFLPAAGDGWGSGLYDSGSDGGYWSSTPSGNPDRTWGLDFHSGDFGQDYFYRLGGEPVRPVRDPVRPFTVTFDANGGLCSTNSKAYSYGAPLGTLPMPTWNWHRFSGWFTAAEGGTEVCASTIVEGPITLYAHWTMGVSGGVQLWQDGPYWAECNVGAANLVEYGYYFWWGDTVGYKRNANNNGWISVKDSTGFSFSYEDCPTYIQDNMWLKENGYIDSTGNLVATRDAATVHFGAPWRMPTSVEIQALVDNCDMTWTTQGGTSGWLVRGRDDYASKSIFLPATGQGDDSDFYGASGLGYYWSSTSCSGYHSAWSLVNSSRYESARYYGQTVRPVRDPGATFTVTFDANGGSCSISSKAYSCGAHFGALPEPTRDGYWFLGWFTAAEGGIEVCASTMVAGSMTLYAHWRTIVSGGVQLWKDGPYWAECNVGAAKPEECGYYFWWGDTVGYKHDANNNGWISVKDSTSFSFSRRNCPTYDTSNSQLQSSGYIDATGNLVAAHDAATAHLGAPWRVPTSAEFDVLVENCTITWTTCNGVAGWFVTGKGTYSSKNIFLPAAGYGGESDPFFGFGSYGDYWSSTPDSDDSGCAMIISFYSNYFGWSWCRRDAGLPIRPVRGFSK